LTLGCGGTLIEKKCNDFRGRKGSRGVEIHRHCPDFSGESRCFLFFLTKNVSPPASFWLAVLPQKFMDVSHFAETKGVVGC
jgi:hypothetical protein